MIVSSPSISVYIWYKHLNLESRILIKTQLNEHNSFNGIAMSLVKDCTTIPKEIKNYICFEIYGTYVRSFNNRLLAYQHSCFKKTLAWLSVNVFLVNTTRNTFALSLQNLLICETVIPDIKMFSWKAFVQSVLYSERIWILWVNRNPDFLFIKPNCIISITLFLLPLDGFKKAITTVSLYTC